MREDLYLIWLTRIEGIGIKKQKLLIDMLGSARGAFCAPRKLLATIHELTPQNIEAILANRTEEMLFSYDRELERKNIRFISIDNPDYPALLKEIPDPPLGFYIIGELPQESGTDCITKRTLNIALIGSRRCTEYGLQVSQKISRDLAAHGVVIVSGMARGIDSMGHKGAIEGGGKTIAVLGCGVDVCYPPENRALREKIIENGCLISEFPPGTQPYPGFFPMRNRIISGLSLAIIVVEAAKKSGTLITVEQALEQGRTVMAVPGNITSKLSQGTNALIKDNAVVVTDYKDVLDSLGVFIEEESANNSNKKHYNKLNLAPEEQVIYNLLEYAPLSFEDIVMKTNSQPQTLLYILSMLEIKGHIQALPGRRYIRT